MLKGKNIIVFSGDQRYLQVIHFLANKQANVFAVGFQHTRFTHQNTQHAYMDMKLLKKADALLLPVHGVDDNGHVHLHYANEKIALSKEMISQTPSHCTIYSGTTNSYLTSLCEKMNRNLVVLFDRDDIAIANSIPTAEATLQIAMDETKDTIHDTNVLVTGFGRIGMTIARLFHQVGANVTVAARKTEDFARIHEMRLNPVHMEELHSVAQQMNICINTVPRRVLTEEIIFQMNKQSLIIDLASSPGGTDFNAAKTRNIKAIHALGLPGKYAPNTAGNIIAQALETLLIQQ